MPPKKAKEDLLKVGRKSDYDEAFDQMAYKLSLLGATDKEMANFFEVSEQTLNTWKKEHPSFLESLKAGKEEADAKVAQSLYKRALGYSHPDTDIKVVQNEIVQTEIVKHYPPDTTAAIFWLKNRKSDQWREKQEIDLGANSIKIVVKEK